MAPVFYTAINVLEFHNVYGITQQFNYNNSLSEKIMSTCNSKNKKVGEYMPPDYNSDMGLVYFHTLLYEQSLTLRNRPISAIV